MTAPSVKKLLGMTLVLALAIPAFVRAQENSALAGTWSLADGSSGRGGAISGIPIATKLVIKISPMQVAVDSDTGSARSVQTSVYKLDGTENPIPGPLGWETKAKAAWEGRRLVVTTRRSIPGPTGDMSVTVTDVYGVNDEVLTIERSLGKNTQTLTYKKS